MKPKWWRFIEANELLFFTFIAVVVLRIPNLWEPYWYGDEGVYLTVGQALANGRELYSGIIDHKTPIIYWVAEAANTLISIKLVLLLAALLSLVLFYFLSKRLLAENKRFHILSVILFAALTTLPTLEGNIFNGELLLMPFVLGGVLLFWKLFSAKKTLRWPWVACGFLFGLAVLTKVPAGFDFGAVILFYLLTFVRGNRSNWRKIGYQSGLLFAGFFLALLLSLIYFWLKGDLSAYLNFGLFYNFIYIQAWGSPTNNPLLAWLISLPGRATMTALGVGLIALMYKKLPKAFVFSLIWFLMAVFAALLSLRPYPHYAIQIVPPAALLAGYIFSKKMPLRLFAGLPLVATYVVWVALGFRPYPTLAYYQNFIRYASKQITEQQYFQWFDAKIPTTYAAAEYIRSKTQADEAIFIWGNEPMVYSLARRIPTGRFIVDFHIESFAGAKAETLATLTADPPRFVLDTRGDTTLFPEFYTWLNQYYRFEKQIGQTTFYKLLSTPREN